MQRRTDPDPRALPGGVNAAQEPGAGTLAPFGTVQTLGPPANSHEQACTVDLWRAFQPAVNVSGGTGKSIREC